MKWRGGGGWGMGSPYGKLFNPQTIETVSGEVISIQKITPYGRMQQGVQLTLKTDQGTLPVHLGPLWYLEHQELTIKPKDKIEVTGSKAELNGKPIMIASQIKKNGQVMILRDKDGWPAWSGWRSQT